MNLKDTLYIRVDGDAMIGAGHVVRSLAVAHAWKAGGGQVHFIGRIESKDLLAGITGHGFEFTPYHGEYPDTDDCQHLIEIMAEETEITNTWCVLDGYLFDSDYQDQLKESGCRILVIDDNAHLPEYTADIILNPNIYAPRLRYHCPLSTELLLGTQFVLLRQQFLLHGRPAKQIPDQASKILITMGGGDFHNVTLKIINALKISDYPGVEVKIVIGPANPHRDSVQNELQDAHFKWEVLGPVDNMAKLMSWADLAITAGGGTCWELAFMGVPFFLVVTADNQKRSATGIADAHAGINMGWPEDFSAMELAGKIVRLLENPQQRRELSQNGQQLVDGRGVLRLMEWMKPSRIYLREAVDDDCAFLYRWEEDNYSGKSEISYEKYRRFYKDLLDDPAKILFIAAIENGENVGSIYVEFSGNIAIMTVKTAIGWDKAGLESRMIEKVYREITATRDIERIDAYVQKENGRLVKAFVKAGFERGMDMVYKGKKTILMYSVVK